MSSNWSWSIPKVIEGEPFDEPELNGGGTPLYQQWLYLLIPITFALFIWMFGEIIHNWWISVYYFSTPRTYSTRVSLRSSDTIRDAISL